MCVRYGRIQWLDIIANNELRRRVSGGACAALAMKKKMELCWTHAEKK